MPYDVQVIPISEFLRADVAGTLEPGASRVFLKELLRVAEEKNNPPHPDRLSRSGQSLDPD